MNVSRGAPGPRPETGDRVAGLVLGAALVATGVLAGVYVDWAVTIMPGTADLDDRTFIETMQHLDDAIQNPIFFLSFSGVVLFPAVSAVVEWRAGRRATAAWVIAALGFSLVGFLITSAVNVPLNSDLVGAGDPAAIADPAKVRKDFEDPWVAWHIVRTVAATAALACMVPALVRFGRRR